MKPPVRYIGVIHETIECSEMGNRFDVVVIGPGTDLDTVTVMSSGYGVSISLRFSREHARRLGELLIASADDVPVTAEVQS